MDSSAIALHDRVITGKRSKDKYLSKSRSDEARANNRSSSRKSKKYHHYSHKKHRPHFEVNDREEHGDFMEEITPRYNKYQSKHYGSFSRHLISAEPPQQCEEIPTLQRLREKIDAIRLMDPYYKTKLTQNELDNFFNSKESIEKKHHHGDGHPLKYSIDVDKASKTDVGGRSPKVATPKRSSDNLKSSKEKFSEDRRRSKTEQGHPQGQPQGHSTSRRVSKQYKEGEMKEPRKSQEVECKKNREGYCEPEQDHPSGMSFTQFRNFLMHSTCNEIGSAKKSSVQLCSEYCPDGCKRILCDEEDEDDDDDECEDF